MEVITQWAIAIVGAVALAAFTELLMPEGDLKKYSNLVLGLIIMVILIQPVAKIRAIDIWSHEFIFDMSMAQADEVDEQQKNLILNTFKNRLAGEIGRQLQSYGNIGVDVELADRENGYGRISRIHLYGVDPKDQLSVLKVIRDNYANESVVAFE